jgi:TolA-binding protein
MPGFSLLILPMRIPALILIAACAVSPALAQIESREGIELQNQILELRQQMQQLQQLQSQASGGYPQAPPMAAPQQAPPGGAMDNDTAAQLVVRVSELEEQVRALQGKVEELNNQLQRQNDDLTKQIGDLAFKLGQGGAAPQPAPPPAEEGGAVPAFAGPQPGYAPPAPTAAPPAPRKTPELMLKEGNAALARRDYAAAEAAARAALNIGGPRQNDAQFLLARAQAGQHQYQAAAAAYYAVYTRGPKSSRAPEALLGVTDSLLALNDRNDACQALAKLAAEFPRAEPGVRARVAAARKRAGCK